jgi:tetratricopeptide (TPR) repeat protein
MRLGRIQERQLLADASPFLQRPLIGFNLLTRAAIVFAVSLISFLVDTVARTQEQPPIPHATEREDENLTDAKRAYEEGSRHYALGDYAESVTFFRRAYEISAVPALLFDIAQAYRLAGSCSKALEGYRHFVRLDPTSWRRPDAEGYMKRLALECGPSSTVSMNGGGPVAKIDLQRTKDSPPETRSSNSPHAWTEWVLLGSGVGLGLGTAGLYIWNNHRYETWSRENQALLGPPPTDPDAMSSWVGRQNSNDDRLRSIKTVDHEVVGLAVVSATCLLGAGLVYVLSRHGPSNGTSLTMDDSSQLPWSVRWP